MMFIYPVEGARKTSNFGKDVLNGVPRKHNGIDLAKSGTVPIHAVADGVVSRSYYSSSYGECIRIIHKINGQTWESLYAHMRSGSRGYTEGQKVKAGAIIGYMGSTGMSTGQHLHFELHKGTWNYEKSNAVDPERYLLSIPVLGYIKIGGTKTGRCYVCDKPSRISKNLAMVEDGVQLPISGSVVGWYEVIWEGKRAYVNERFGKRV